MELNDVSNNIELYIDSDSTNSVLCELNSFLQLPSKRIRSKLAMLYIDAQNKSISEEIYKNFSAIELIHNASLLHDDVIDNSAKRRGETTIAKKFSDKISVIAGDLLVINAIKIIFSINNTEISKLFLDCVNTMCNTEINQYLNRDKVITLEEYIETAKGKTAILFKTSMEATAILTNSDKINAGKFGELFGIIFQIRNDCEPSSAENDKKNGVCTINNIQSIEKTNSLIDNYKEEMRSIIKDFPNKANGLEDLINKL